MYSTPGEIEIAPRKCGPSPGMHFNSGSPSSPKFTFPDDPRNLYRFTSCKNSPGNSLGSRNFSNVRCGSTLDETTFAVSSSPLVSATPLTRPDRKSTRLNSSHSQISYAVFCLKKKKQ